MESLRCKVIAELIGGLWHTTSESRFASIMRTGAILANPDIPDSERWATACGPKGYPFVRKLGGVSLFDFSEFDSEKYSEDYPLSSWYEFVPYRKPWGSSIWIEVNRELTVDFVVSTNDLLDRWKKENSHGHRIMPLIEAAYIGNIDKSNFVRVLRVADSGVQVVPHDRE